MSNLKSERKKKKNKLLKIIVPAVICAVLATSASVYLFDEASLEGHWKLVEIRATPERIESLPTTQRAMLKQHFEEQLDREGLELQFYDDGTGLMTLNVLGISENHVFRWVSDNATLSKRIGILSQDFEYDVSRSRLILINHEEEGGTIREFERINR